mmetsp:Transcript_20407/g.44487  ORF Transcript_20407/g.44487 Transcript_20407/m.44487 type:complete len:228 (-) Transcript_20407:276-959(-)
MCCSRCIQGATAGPWPWPMLKPALASLPCPWGLPAAPQGLCAQQGQPANSFGSKALTLFSIASTRPSTASLEVDVAKALRRSATKSPKWSGSVPSTYAWSAGLRGKASGTSWRRSSKLPHTGSRASRWSMPTRLSSALILSASCAANGRNITTIDAGKLKGDGCSSLGAAVAAPAQPSLLSASVGTSSDGRSAVIALSTACSLMGPVGCCIARSARFAKVASVSTWS